MNNKILIPLLLALSISAAAKQKDSTKVFTLDLQTLARGEIRDGGWNQIEERNAKLSAFLVSRARLLAGYSRPNLDIKLSLQHQGVWGEAGGGSFNIYEAWAKVYTNWGLFAQIGRQALAYDDERILGPDDWSVTGYTHDVLKAGYEGHGVKFHTLFAFNQNADVIGMGSTYYYGGRSPYKTMQMGWLHYDVPVFPLGVSILALNIGMQGGTEGKDEHVEWQQLIGGYAKYSPKYWSLEAAYYKQMGFNEKHVPLDAWMASAKACINPSDIYGFELGYDYMSGDDSFVVTKPGALGLIQHKVLKGFTPVYGSHHSFYGAMDYFYISTFVHGFSPGLQNAFVKAKVNPIKTLSASVAYHYLAIATDLSHSGIGRTLGHELEVEASWNFFKDANLSFGFSYMAGTENMQKLKRAADSGRLIWTWLSISFSPRLLEHRR